MNAVNESSLIEKLHSDGLENVIATIENDYRENKHLRDQYAMLGNIFQEKNDNENAFKCFDQDRQFDRISPAYRHILAFVLSKLERFNEAKSAVQRAFFEDPTLNNGYRLIDHQTGFSNLKMAGTDIIGEPYNMGGNSEDMLHHSRRLAQFQCWDEASRLVEKAYIKKDNLLDGYSYIGSVLRALVRFGCALKFYEKDSVLDRISPTSRIIYAQLLARAGMIPDAENEVQLAYKTDSALKDGFACIGTVFRIEGDNELALGYFEIDNMLNRLSATQRHIYADQLARAGRFKEAMKEVERGYRENQCLMNGFGRIANLLRINGNYEEALSCYQLDRGQNRLTLWHIIGYSELLFSANNHEKAIFELLNAFETYPDANDNLSRIAIKIKDMSDVGLQALLGLTYQLSDRTLLGLVYRSQTNTSLSGKIKLQGTPLSALGTRSLDIDWTNPQWAELGLRYALTEDTTLFMNAGWQQWSKFSQNSLDFVDFGNL